MYARLILALFVSTLLVGGALWTRLSNSAEVEYNLATVKSNEAAKDGLLEYFLNSATSTSQVPIKPLPQGDVLGQQLIMEYVDLATNGTVSDEKIAELADKYVESIPNLTQAPTISPSDLKTVADTKENFQKYADEVTAIHRTYAETITKNQRGVNVGTLNRDLYRFLLVFSGAYDTAANRLKNLPVPASLTQAHLKLVNSYLSSAAATKAISEMEKDSAVAFAGLVIFNENLNKEEVLLGEISQILTSKGL